MVRDTHREMKGDPRVSLATNMRSIIDDAQLSNLLDATIRTSNGESIKVSKVLLAARSPIFRKIFLKENAVGGKELQLDYSLAVMKDVVDFCYTGDTDLSLPKRERQGESQEKNEEHVRKLVQLVLAAEYFQLPELKRIAIHSMFEIATSNRLMLCSTLDEAIMKNNTISNISLELIGLYPENLLQSSEPFVCGGISSLSYEAMRKVASGNFLCSNEEVVFNILHEWAGCDWKAAESKRQYTHSKTSWSQGTEVVIQNSDEFRAERLKEAEIICSKTINLYKIRPEVLMTKVAESGFVSQKDIAVACMKQRKYEKEYGDCNFLFSSHRNTRVGNNNAVLIIGAGISEVNGVYRQDKDKYIGRSRNWGGKMHMFFCQRMSKFCKELKENNVCPCLETRYNQRGNDSWLLYAIEKPEPFRPIKFIILYECMGDKEGNVHRDGFFKPTTESNCSSHSSGISFQGEYPCGRHLRFAKDAKYWPETPSIVISSCRTLVFPNAE